MKSEPVIIEGVKRVNTKRNIIIGTIGVALAIIAFIAMAGVTNSTIVCVKEENENDLQTKFVYTGTFKGDKLTKVAWTNEMTFAEESYADMYYQSIKAAGDMTENEGMTTTIKQDGKTVIYQVEVDPKKASSEAQAQMELEGNMVKDEFVKNFEETGFKCN